MTSNKQTTEKDGRKEEWMALTNQWTSDAKQTLALSPAKALGRPSLSGPGTLEHSWRCITCPDEEEEEKADDADDDGDDDDDDDDDYGDVLSCFCSTC